MPTPSPAAVALDAPPFRLRPFADVDATLYAALFMDAEVMRSIGVPFDADRAARAAAAALRHQGDSMGRFRHWVIEHVEGTAGLLGLALRSTAWAGGEAELGVLLWPSWQGRGAATAAIRAVRSWAFDVAGLAVLTCHHADAHAGAEALMRRVGFTRCASRGAMPEVGWECLAAPATGHPQRDPLG